MIDEENMSMPIMGEQQKKEIKTIKERKITVKLSDKDCNRLARKCGKHGLTVGELIENFIGDLVGGTYSNGSPIFRMVGKAM
jgi:predicted DNA binding CopG/RHH family protein